MFKKRVIYDQKVHQGALRKVKGVCPVCEAQRAFRITLVTQHSVDIRMLGAIYVETLPTHRDYEGACSKGHETPFELVKPLPSKSYRMDDDVQELIKGGRSSEDRETYLRRLEQHHNPEREAHYRPDHQCTEDCPEYDYPDYPDYC